MVVEDKPYWLPPQSAAASLTRLVAGASAEVFAWGADCVLKLYHRDFPPEAIALELKNARLAKALAIATPTPLGHVQVEGRVGLVLERVDGPTAYEVLQSRGRSPESLGELASLGRAFFDLQQTIHRCQSRELEPLQASLAQRIRRSELLPHSLKREVIDTLRAAPVVDTVCHGDFHPLNMMLASSGPVVIDWLDMACGDPALDVVRTLLYLRFGRRQQTDPAARSEFIDGYLARCREVWAGRLEQLQSWQRPVTAARLAERRVDGDERVELMRLLDGPPVCWFSQQ